MVHAGYPWYKCLAIFFPLKNLFLKSYFSSSPKLRDETACHLNVSVPENLFLFCIFDRFGFFIFVKAASEGGDRVLTGGKVVKIYDSLRSKWSASLEWKVSSIILSNRSLGGWGPHDSNIRFRFADNLLTEVSTSPLDVWLIGLATWLLLGGL